MYVKLDLSCLKGILISHFHPADIDCIEDFRKLFSRFSPCCLPWPQFWFFLPLHPLSWNLKISALLTACLIWNTEWSHGGHKMEKKVEILPQVWDFELWIMNVSNEILDECWRWVWAEVAKLQHCVNAVLFMSLDWQWYGALLTRRGPFCLTLILIFTVKISQYQYSICTITMIKFIFVPYSILYAFTSSALAGDDFML